MLILQEGIRGNWGDWRGFGGLFWRDQHFCQCSFSRALPTYSDDILHIPVHVKVYLTMPRHRKEEASLAASSHLPSGRIELMPQRARHGSPSNQRPRPLGHALLHVGSCSLIAASVLITAKFNVCCLQGYFSVVCIQEYLSVDCLQGYFNVCCLQGYFSVDCLQEYFSVDCLQGSFNVCCLQG